MTQPRAWEQALDAAIEGRITVDDAGRLLEKMTPVQIDRRAAARANTVKVTPERVLELVELPHSLIAGRLLRCPGCEGEHDILAYTPLNHSRKYEEQIVIPYVCPGCKHIFALRP